MGVLSNKTEDLIRTIAKSYCTDHNDLAMCGKLIKEVQVFALGLQGHVEESLLLKTVADAAMLFATAWRSAIGDDIFDLSEKEV